MMLSSRATGLAVKLHYLRYFAVLADELHFGRAAQRLSITQPPLSSAIKGLEAELGTPLFLRDSKRVELTPAGEAFRMEVLQILEGMDRASKVARAVAGGLKGRLDIGATGSLMYRGLPAILRRFEKAMPGIELVLKEMSSAEQVDELLRGQLHAGFLNASAVPPQLDSLPLADDEFVCCLPSAHALAGRKSVRLSELASERFVMFARDVAPANYDNVAAIFSRERIHPRTVHAARQWLTVLAMVAHELGVSVVPRSLSQTRISGVCFVPLQKAIYRSSALLAWNPEHMTEPLRTLVRCASDVLGQPVPDSA